MSTAEDSDIDIFSSTELADHIAAQADAELLIEHFPKLKHTLNEVLCDLQAALPLVITNESTAFDGLNNLERDDLPSGELRAVKQFIQRKIVECLHESEREEFIARVLEYTHTHSPRKNWELEEIENALGEISFLPPDVDKELWFRLKVMLRLPKVWQISFQQFETNTRGDAEASPMVLKRFGASRPTLFVDETKERRASVPILRLWSDVSSLLEHPHTVDEVFNGPLLQFADPILESVLRKFRSGKGTYSYSDMKMHLQRAVYYAWERWNPEAGMSLENYIRQWAEGFFVRNRAIEQGQFKISSRDLTLYYRYLRFQGDNLARHGVELSVEDAADLMQVKADKLQKVINLASVLSLDAPAQCDERNLHEKTAADNLDPESVLIEESENDFRKNLLFVAMYEALDEEERHALIFKYGIGDFDGLSDKEIGKECLGGISRTNVQYRLKIIREKLKEVMLTSSGQVSKHMRLATKRRQDGVSRLKAELGIEVYKECYLECLNERDRATLIKVYQLDGNEYSVESQLRSELDRQYCTRAKTRILERIRVYESEGIKQLKAELGVEYFYSEWLDCLAERQRQVVERLYGLDQSAAVDAKSLSREMGIRTDQVKAYLSHSIAKLKKRVLKPDAPIGLDLVAQVIEREEMKEEWLSGLSPKQMETLRIFYPSGCTKRSSLRDAAKEMDCNIHTSSASMKRIYENIRSQAELHEKCGLQKLADDLDLDSIEESLMDCLTPRSFQIIAKYYGIGSEFPQPLNEIASELGIKEGAAKMVLHRARKRILKEIASRENALNFDGRKELTADLGMELDDLEERIDALNPAYKWSLIHRYGIMGAERMSYEEMADVRGTSVKAQIHNVSRAKYFIKKDSDKAVPVYDGRKELTADLGIEFDDIEKRVAGLSDGQYWAVSHLFGICGAPKMSYQEMADLKGTRVHNLRCMVSRAKKNLIDSATNELA